jgi:hypothetical protein
MRLPALLLLAATLSAPLQCARRPGPDVRTEDDPAEVLSTLAERFKTQGNAAARTETLRYLVSRYPESRFAQAARLELGVPQTSQTSQTSPTSTASPPGPPP